MFKFISVSKIDGFFFIFLLILKFWHQFNNYTNLHGIIWHASSFKKRLAGLLLFRVMNRLISKIKDVLIAAKLNNIE
jgi:hypothetical protein